MAVSVFDAPPVPTGLRKESENQRPHLAARTFPPLEDPDVDLTDAPEPRSLDIPNPHPHLRLVTVERIEVQPDPKPTQGFEVRAWMLIAAGLLVAVGYEVFLGS